MEDVSEKLVMEDRHFVRLHSGRIKVSTGDDGLVDKLTYQRLCISTEDGGVISLDWPSNLNLREEHGLDTTLLLVPGTPEGSMDRNVRLSVIEALGRGLFPIVMNPRGCAGSPLTTARYDFLSCNDFLYYLLSLFVILLSPVKHDLCCIITHQRIVWSLMVKMVPEQEVTCLNLVTTITL